MTEEDVLAILKEECEKAGGQKAWGDAHGISPSRTSNVLNKRCMISKKIARALGVERHPKMTKDEVIAILAEECAKAGGQKAWSSAHCLSRVHINELLNRRAGIGEKVARALGLEKLPSEYRMIKEAP